MFLLEKFAKAGLLVVELLFELHRSETFLQGLVGGCHELIVLSFLLLRLELKRSFEYANLKNANV
jgi:hypothetical protein